jgi:bifunctional non-homologous end joining protein LigD
MPGNPGRRGQSQSVPLPVPGLRPTSRPMRSRLTPAGFVLPCLPSPVAAPPSGPGWLHEIKHDRFRLLVRRDVDRVRAFTRNGHDWAARYPAITAAAASLRARSFLIDGEVVVADPQGLASFELLRTHTRGKQAFVCLLELDGEDLRALPLEQPRANCKHCSSARRSAWRSTTVASGDGPALFREACPMGLEGIVSKRANSRYCSGRSSDWVKAKNSQSATAQREAVEDWGKRR